MIDSTIWGVYELFNCKTSFCTCINDSIAFVALLQNLYYWKAFYVSNFTGHWKVSLQCNTEVHIISDFLQ